jgi:hypothetical protein
MTANLIEYFVQRLPVDCLICCELEPANLFDLLLSVAAVAHGDDNNFANTSVKS